MKDDYEDFYKKIYVYIYDFHVNNGANDRDANILALLNVYRCRSWKNDRRIDLVCNLRNDISKIIREYRIKNKATPLEIIHCLYREIENIILVEEEIKKNQENEITIRVFIEEGILKFRCIYRS